MQADFELDPHRNYNMFSHVAHSPVGLPEPQGLTPIEPRGDQKRHCWECLRRCLVCDSTKPACNRCSSSGTICPGYGHVKPTRFRWLAPGRVKSRRQRLKDTPRSDYGHGGQVDHRQPPEQVSIPSFNMGIDADALVVQAADYFNACIYQDLTPVHGLGRNPHIYRISSALIREARTAPEYLQLSMACMTLSHRMNRTRGDPRSNNKALTQKFYLYRGAAIRSLREHLDLEHHCRSDLVVAGVVSLMLADIQHGASENWRTHMDGAIKLVQMRGGFSALADLTSLRPQLLCLCYTAVIGNTTCPASHLHSTGAHLDALDIILQQAGAATSPFQMCPLPLFAEIIRTNHLRTRAVELMNRPAGVESLSNDAHELLSHVDNFAPDIWAESKTSSKQDWVLIGKIYKAATTLYCISSLQSLSVLPATTSLRSRCATCGQVLLKLLAEGLVSLRIRRYTLWPLVVLGVEAVHDRGTAMRAFIAEQLPVLSCDLGTHIPLTAKGVLDRFWYSGGTGWDACFDRPYAFTTQIAADMSQIYHPR